MIPQRAASRSTHRQKPTHVLGELAKDQVAAVAAKIAMILFADLRQYAGILFARLEPRTFGQQAIFIAVSEQELAEGDQIGVVLIGLGAGRAEDDPSRKTVVKRRP